MSGQGALGQHALSTFCCCALVCGDIVQPLQGWLWFGWLTQGRNRWFQPWAILWNPVGILPRRCSAALFVSANSAFNESLGQGQTLSSPPAGERKKVRGRPAMLSLTWLKHSPSSGLRPPSPPRGRRNGIWHPLRLGQAGLDQAG